MTKNQIDLIPKRLEFKSLTDLNLKASEDVLFKNLNKIKYQYLLDNVVRSNDSIKLPSVRTDSLHESSVNGHKLSEGNYDPPRRKSSWASNDSYYNSIEKTNVHPYFWISRESRLSETKIKPPSRLPSIKIDTSKIEPKKSNDTISENQKSDSILRFKVDSFLSIKSNSQINLRKSHKSSVDFSENDSLSTTEDDDVFINNSEIIKQQKYDKNDKKQKNLSPLRTRRTVLSESELKSLKISEKFMKDAKNMIYIPEQNSFCPRNTFYYLNSSKK
ncbi:unnamed protein product [Brachionus calyciflorus]|uniref:Uncharacterized protein n=1 Tax=Brachionus calyciflorus TaxID=104777 RepID=A0A813MGQ1_9BILA|nr:unnamed protein product [Brachionus calyciflorus]